MSRGIITNIDDAENNNYIITIPHLGEVKAQCASADEILLGTEVRLVDVDNVDPAKTLTFGPLRFLPNTHADQTTQSIPNYLYTNGGVWKTPSELYSTNNGHSLVVSYILSSERNPKWQKEYPLYKRGKVISITDEKYMSVDIYGDMTRSCRTDYMTCDTAAFVVGDVVIVFYENGSFFKPVVVGFWDSPVPCDIPIMQLTLRYPAPGFATYSIFVTNIEFSPDGSNWISTMGPEWWDVNTQENTNPGEGGGYPSRPIYDDGQYKFLDQSYEESLVVWAKKSLWQYNRFRVTYNTTAPTLDRQVLILWQDSYVSQFDGNRYGVAGTIVAIKGFTGVPYNSGDVLQFDWNTFI